MCGESWLATKDLYPPSQFSRLGIQVSLAIICLFVWAMVGWVALPFFSFLFFFKLVCYAHVFPYTHTYHVSIDIHT